MKGLKGKTLVPPRDGQAALDTAVRLVAQGRAYELREVALGVWTVGPAGVGVGAGAGSWGRVSLTRLKNRKGYVIEWEATGKVVVELKKAKAK